MKYKHDHLIVFDWNGTILADTTACVHATNKVLKVMGFPKITRAHYQRHYTMPIVDLYHAMGVTADVIKAHEEEIHPLWHDTYDKTNIRLRRGAKQTLQHLREASCTSIILSNYVVQRIDTQARRLGVREHFHEILAFQHDNATFRVRGKGERLEKYLKENPASVGIIVGDSEEEVEIGRQLGFATVAITDGMCSTARLRKMKPDFLIQSLHQIPEIAEDVFGIGNEHDEKDTQEVA